LNRIRVSGQILRGQNGIAQLHAPNRPMRDDMERVPIPMLGELLADRRYTVDICVDQQGFKSPSTVGVPYQVVQQRLVARRRAIDNDQLPSHCRRQAAVQQTIHAGQQPTILQQGDFFARACARRPKQRRLTCCVSLIDHSDQQASLTKNSPTLPTIPVLAWGIVRNHRAAHT
jgi:hypothetical protein